MVGPIIAQTRFQTVCSLVVGELVPHYPNHLPTCQQRIRFTNTYYHIIIANGIWGSGSGAGQRSSLGPDPGG